MKRRSHFPEEEEEDVTPPRRRRQPCDVSKLVFLSSMVSLIVVVVAVVAVTTTNVPTASGWILRSSPATTGRTSFVSNTNRPLLSSIRPRPISFPLSTAETTKTTTVMSKVFKDNNKKFLHPTTRSTTFLQARKKSTVDDDDEDDWDVDDDEIEYVYEEEEEEDDDDEDIEYEFEDEVYDDEDEDDEDEEEEEEEDDNAVELEVDDDGVVIESHAQINDKEEEEIWEEEEEIEREDYETKSSVEGDVIASADWEDEGEYPLEDDPDDPNYQKQKELMELAVEESDRVGRDRNFDAMDYMMNHLDEDQIEKLDQLSMFQEVNENAKPMLLSEQDLEDHVVDLEKEMEETTDLIDDPYPRHEEGEDNYLEEVTDDEMEELDSAWKKIRQVKAQTPWNKVELRAKKGFDGLGNETMEEIFDCMEIVGPAAYNITNWLLYDLDFNVTNLMLAACKHNREAPIFFQHWWPQLSTCSRYKDAQERDFDFTWDDVDNADLSELERYYQGFGYDEIPQKAPSETGMVEFEYLDEEEIKMAAFETWINDVYNPEWDKRDFDDDDWQDEDNVFSKYFEPPPHPEMPKFEQTEADLAEWHEDMGTDEELKGDEAAKAYRDFVLQGINYTVVEDQEFEEEFRGHLIVACTGDDADLEIAEKITLAMEEAHGKQVFVETQVIAHAREEDNVFEVWLESYEIELLHSKKRATSGAKGWTGPAECDDRQVEYLVETVGYLISDDSRYSYSYGHEFEGSV